MSRLVVVTGPDGSGKSTACAAARAVLDARLGRGATREITVWDAIDAGPFFRDRRDAMRYLLDNDGPARLLLLYHSLARALALARREEPRIILANGWWYKYAVSEVGYGLPIERALAAGTLLPSPDAVVCIDIDPETAFARKREASEYEGGAASFLAFQATLRPCWAAVEAATGGWTHVDGTLAPEAVRDAVVRAAIR